MSMRKLKPNAVSRPAHYTKGKVECIDAIESALGLELFIGFLRGQVIKYDWRCAFKGFPVQDVEKALWYSQLLVKKMREAEAINITEQLRLAETMEEIE